MHIGVDFDDVLFPYHHYLKRRLQRRFGVDLLGHKVTTFYYENLPEFRSRGITREAVWEEVQATWSEAASHDEAGLLDAEAAPVLRDLAKRHKVTVVTARSKNSRSYVEAFLRRHAVAHHDLAMGHQEKSGFDVLVDDFPSHAMENAAGGGWSLLYTIDENSTFDESRHPRIRRVWSWREARDAVEKLERRRPSIA